MMTAPAGEPVDLQHINGQEHIKRGLEVAAAGGHALLLTRAPGSGKTTLARALPGLLPPLSEAEAAEVTVMASLVNPSGEQPLPVDRRPCVAPPQAERRSTVAGRVGCAWGR